MPSNDTLSDDDPLKELIRDAQLVADAAVRLGRLQSMALLSDLKALKAAIASGTDLLEPTVALQTSLNTAVKEISPITVRDLRSKDWSPFVAKSKGWPTFIFGLFAILLICVTAYATSFYNRVSFAHASLVEIQTARVSEQVMKLYDMLRYNQAVMIQAFKGGTSQDVMIDSFYKSYFDLRNTDERLKVMVQESFALTEQATVLTRVGETIVDAIPWLGNTGEQTRTQRAEIDKNLDQVRKWQEAYGRTSVQLLVEESQTGSNKSVEITHRIAPVVPPPGTSGKPIDQISQQPAAGIPPAGASGKPIDQICQQSALGIPLSGTGDKTGDQKPADPKAGAASVDTLIDALHFLFFNASTFICETGLNSVNPVQPIPTYWAILRLHETMNTFGLWYLPALYGMLGACVFHMRRFLDPSAPNPSWIRTAFRIFLGAFAGIVVVWFWSPAAQKGADQAIPMLSSFTVAFLVGFSIDIFFQALDRLVTKVSQAIG
jgi:hypothetical protein